jgi:ribosomal protein S18 acetylase RimI-like enzyme
MSPIERFSFIAIRRPDNFTSRLLMFLAGVKDLIAFDVYVDEVELVLGTTGLYRYKKDFDRAVWLAWFCVDPKARGRGIGQALLDHTVARARDAGFSLMRLYTSTDPNEASAQRLYERNGFMEVGRKRGLHSTTVFREKKIDQVKQSFAAAAT